MKTLATSNSNIGNNTVPSYFSASSLKDRLLSGGPEFISYRRPRKLPNSGLQHLVPLRRGGIDLISCFSSHSQVDTQNDEVENQDTNKSKTVRVKFQLQKECTFGEHFFIVGDDPMFGSWDVTNAIPLNWADGHQWAAEVEIPVGKTIQFKFVLQGITGNVVWQPDPDRTFQPWETTNTIIISEDWDSAESRILCEEEKFDNQLEDSPIVPEKLLVAENVTYINGEQVHNTNKDSPVALSDSSVAEKSLMESYGELIDGSNVSALALEENTSNVSLSEDNASNTPASKENIMAEAPKTSNKAVSKVQSNSNGETTITSKSDTKITEENLKKEEKDATVKILGNTDVQGSFIDYGVPILVPGFPPTTATSSQDQDAILVPGLPPTTATSSQDQDAILVPGLPPTTATSSQDQDAILVPGLPPTTATSSQDQDAILVPGLPPTTATSSQDQDVILVPGLPPTTATSSQDQDVILVPGLPPTTATSSQDQDAPQHEVEDDVSINGINKLPQKQDPDVVAEHGMEGKSSYEEDVVQSEIIQEDDTNKIENDIVQNDITWGHKTLKKFFSSLRLL